LREHHWQCTAQLLDNAMCALSLQPANTFLDSQGNVKLGDFGA
jgi:hypothetical protein